jgi:Flp pilus assembly protein TadD
MKIKISLIIIAILMACPLSAQNGLDQLKSAKKVYNIFLINQSDKAKLVEATDNIDAATRDGEITNEASLWLLRGDIYNEIATQQIIIRTTGIGDASELPKRQYPSLTAFDAYKKAKKLAQKNYETKDAVKGIRKVQSNLTNTGVFNFDDSDYQGAYNLFIGVVEAHYMLKDAGAESALDKEEDYNEQLYITGLAALNAQMNSEAKGLFDELYKKKYDKPMIYEALYNITVAEEGAAIKDAYEYLEEGRKIYPDDVSLLFAEINHFLKTNQLEELVSKLETAITKEPGNVSLYNTLGNVYDNLYRREEQGGDPDMGNNYFNNALKYYGQAIATDPKNFDSNYSLGALYFNKAAMESKVLVVLGDDISSEGMKKYEKKQAEIMDIFGQALPYFKKAESLNPNDTNTLIALKEIYARKGDLTTSNIFKDRLQTVQNGGSNTAYFRN